MKLLCQRMNLNIWEIIDASKTKPFGFQAFYPGPGLGGHCIPIDPYYLSWKAREFDFATRFIELAGEVNTNMPYEVVNRITNYLSTNGVCLNGARLLVLGLAYKKNVDDCRESPAIKILKILADRGAHLSYYDPHVKNFVSHRYGKLRGSELQTLTEDEMAKADGTIILTDHDAFDYDQIVKFSKLIIDTRNATRNVSQGRAKIVLA
jgi:UDP-N-acetyl-D-glucosamine dehydrogenase